MPGEVVAHFADEAVQRGHVGESVEAGQPLLNVHLKIAAGGVVDDMAGHRARILLAGGKPERVCSMNSKVSA